jgi:hypothetical protein
VSETRKDKTVEEVGVSGWVEVIVRDKDGRVKYHIGSPPPKPAEKTRAEGGEEGDRGDCPEVVPGPLASLPVKFMDFYWRKNIITDVGLAEIIRLVFSGLTGTKFGYIAIGTGTTAEAATDTALQAEIKRKTATVTQTTTTITNDTALLEATFSSADGLTGTSNVSEAGVFNASTGGTLLARKVFSAVPLNWDAGDSITIRYYVQVGR